MPGLRIETRTAAAIQDGRRSILPFAQVLHLTLPGIENAGLIWNRPVTVLVREADGSEQVIPIPDITRQAQVFLLGLGLFGAFLIWLANRNRQETQREEQNE